MSSDLPPGVRGPIPDPRREFDKTREGNVTDSYPTTAKTHWMNPMPYMSAFVAYTFHIPAVKLKHFVESLQSPVKRRYYHEKFVRVPEIWECKMDDSVCIYEAEAQFKRDKMVDTAILELLEKDMNHCRHSYPITWEESCRDSINEFWTEKKNWHTKYADLGIYQSARTVLNKQKNRFIEKRYKERVGMELKDDWIFQDYDKKILA